MMTIKPIETRYKGYLFRSRLEARWAVFFDALGIKWEYEPEGYDLGKAGWYLPDFWLAKIEIWVEVKPVAIVEYGQEWDKLTALRDAHHPIALLQGNIAEEERLLFTHDCTDSSGGASERYFEWFCCSRCNRIWPDVSSNVDSLFTGSWQSIPFRCEHTVGIDRTKSNNQKAINNAYTAARAARFEHGENGGVL
jgi:hypothetical protein